jgi:hypothetical protein
MIAHQVAHQIAANFSTVWFAGLGLLAAAIVVLHRALGRL